MTLSPTRSILWCIQPRIYKLQLLPATQLLKTTSYYSKINNGLRYAKYSSKTTIFLTRPIGNVHQNITPKNKLYFLKEQINSDIKNIHATSSSKKTFEHLFGPNRKTLSTIQSVIQTRKQALLNHFKIYNIYRGNRYCFILFSKRFFCLYFKTIKIVEEIIELDIL